MSMNWRTRLIHSERKVPEGFRSLATPVFRGSTTLFRLGVFECKSMLEGSDPAHALTGSTTDLD